MNPSQKESDLLCFQTSDSAYDSCICCSRINIVEVLIEISVKKKKKKTSVRITNHNISKNYKSQLLSFYTV